MFDAADNPEERMRRAGGRTHIRKPRAPGEAPAERADADGADAWDAGEDDFNVPPRAWLLGTVFCRRFISSVLADGGVGKTALRVAQLMSLAIGRSLTGEHVHRRCRVLIVSLEDDRDELRRRVRAAMLHHRVDAAELRGHLFLAAPKGLRLAEMRDGVPAVGALHGWLTEQIGRLRPDIISLDPFIKAHGMDENSNGAVDYACTILAKLAIEHDLAVDVPHHVNKGLAAAGDANRGRGASAMKDAARLVFTLTPMSPEEAAGFSLSDAQRRALVRLDTAKVNIAPPAASAAWFELVGVPLGNGTDAYPHGDRVQTVQPWTPPDVWGALDVPTLNRILDDIDAGTADGGRYSPSPRLDVERAAWRAVAKHAPDMTPEACHKIIASWLRTGLLTVETYTDAAQRKERKGVSVTASKRPGTSL